MRPRRGRWHAAVLFARGPGGAEEGSRPSHRLFADAPRAAERPGDGGGRGASHIPRAESKPEFPDTGPRSGLRLHVLRVRGERAGEERAGPPREREGRRGDGRGEGGEERPVPRGSEEGAAQQQPRERDHRGRVDRYR